MSRPRVPHPLTRGPAFPSPSSRPTFRHSQDAVTFNKPGLSLPIGEIQILAPKVAAKSCGVLIINHKIKA